MRARAQCPELQREEINLYILLEREQAEIILDRFLHFLTQQMSAALDLADQHQGAMILAALERLAAQRDARSAPCLEHAKHDPKDCDDDRRHPHRHEKHEDVGRRNERILKVTRHEAHDAGRHIRRRCTCLNKINHLGVRRPSRARLYHRHAAAHNGRA